MLRPTESAEDHHLHHHPEPLRIIPSAHSVTRRGMLGASAALAGVVLTGGVLPAWAQKGARPTSQETLGPFYPIDVPADQDADLTIIAGHKDHALGQIVYVSGKVTDMKGAPVPNATLEIWQANAAGRYAHPADQSKSPLDENFQGFARIRTGADGTYSFKTIKPAAYPTGEGDWMRPPHIHFDVRGRASRITTQMYFEGEALNEKDRLLQSHSKGGRDSMMSRTIALSGQQERDAKAVSWDIVLIAG